MKPWYRRPLLCVLIILLAASASAQGEKPRWKFLQVKHFTAQPGVNISTEAFEYFYRAIIEKMQGSKLAEQVVEDAAAVPPDAAADSVVLEGVFTYFDPGRALHAGGLNATFTLYRVSDRRLLMTKLWQVSALATSNPKVFRIAGNMASGQIIKPARELKPLATFPPAPPEQAPPATATAAPVTAARATAPTAAAAPNLPAMPHHDGPYAALLVKPLTIAPGVGFPPNGGNAQAYLDAFDKHFLTELVKQKFAASAVPEGANATDGADAYLVEGTITGFRVEHKQVLLSGVDVGVMTFQFVFLRPGDHAPQGMMTLVLDNLVLGAFTKPDRFASSVPHYLVGEMKKH